MSEAAALRSAERRAVPAEVPTPQAQSRHTRAKRALVVAAQLTLGLALGLAITEAVFSMRADGAFPHVNFYVADPELGVRLEPGAQMKFKLGSNPASTIHVNSAGFRGDEWPAPGAAEIVVVGDSQVFGLGVDDDATFSALLSEQTGRTVINAGVPTYGPREYLATAREVIERRKPQTLVYVINFVNDGFELGRPNPQRHNVWDGWAVRSETAPTNVTGFPGRKWLFQRSHAVYALRRWWYGRDKAFDAEGETKIDFDLGVPSEGDWSDLVARGRSSAEERANMSKSATRKAEKEAERLAAISKDIEGQEALVESIVYQRAGTLKYDEEIIEGKPGDIVGSHSAEAGRELLVTAAMIRKAVRIRNAQRKALLEAEARAGESTELADALARSDALVEDRNELRDKVAGGPPPPEGELSLFEDHLGEVKAMCDERGVELVVVALPIDVQVSSAEWAKYGTSTPIDMEPSLVLLDDVVASAHRLGARAVDVTNALRAAEPGAFLDGDIHMTQAGHAAVATALADTLEGPPPLQLPRPGLPHGLSAPPGAREWQVAGEAYVKGSTAAGCSTKRIGHWFKVSCRKRYYGSNPPTGLELQRGGVLESMTLVTKDAATLLTPIRPGRELVARFWWRNRARDLELTWPLGERGVPKFTAVFEDAASPGRPATIAPAANAICDCHATMTYEQWCRQRGQGDDSWVSECAPSCREALGSTSADCLAAFSGDCNKLLACVAGDPLAAPGCDDGEILVPVIHECATPCDENHPCEEGVCEAYNGGGICR